MESKEIERKFLVKDDSFKDDAFSHNRIVQGFLSTVPERTVRVRISDKKGYLTVKGLGNVSGTTRFEWEKEIDLTDAENLLKICERGKIEKIRYLVKSGNHTFEVDEFYADNQGLVIAEVELKEENENFRSPKWLGEEVTGDTKYYNSALSQHPYTTWHSKNLD